MTPLDREACWDMLRAHSFARIGYVLRGEVRIVPINYAVSGDRLVFRTADDSKFYALSANEHVGFELDEVGQDTARSVIARGRAHLLEDESEVAEATATLHPWVPTEKRRVVAIEMTHLSGRAFRLQRD
ncbi:MAG TPA: pyridoxamine 5'-phosphate oxidase family protein [Dermatophilaceae bacterium]|nr:pyridoxamine 5'-phosphate oxidase family protein [Dermatophilaceae bacterium]